jgi:hypothetical protein
VIKIWSELPGARAREQIADVVTLGWVTVWSYACIQLYTFLAGFAAAGRTVRGGGQAMVDSGVNVGDAVSGIPLVGEQLKSSISNAFAGAGRPLIDMGSSLEAFILMIATILALVVALVTLQPWLSRYLPWRLARLRRVRSAHRVIRQRRGTTHAEIERTLALRAVARLDYWELLEYSPDPFGDWAAGRHDRLARAELASVGLRHRTASH